MRDATNTLATNQSVGMQKSILQTTITGTVVYETYSVTTNINGLVSLEIGAVSTSDDFSAIDWSAGSYFIKTETDPTGGSSYTFYKCGRALQLCRGLTPIIRRSGSRVNARARIRKIRTQKLRNLVFMCSFNACKYNKACTAIYDSIVAKGTRKN